MVASGFGAVDRVAKAGDSMTGPLVLSGSTPLQVTTTSPGTGKVLVSDASGNASWGTAGASGVTVPLSLSGSQAASSILSVTNTASAPSVEAVVVTSQTAGDRAVGIQVAGDTNKRLSVDSNGLHMWGPGNAAADTNLYRSGVNTLQTDQSFVVGLSTAIGASLQVGSVFASFGGGSGVIGLSNASTVPTTNPGSGLIIYSQLDAPRWRSSNGDVYQNQFACLSEMMRPTGAIAETMPRVISQFSPNSASGTLILTPIWLPKGLTVSNFNFLAFGAGTTMTHQWAGLYNASRVQLAVTQDKTTTAITANSTVTWPVATIATGASTTFVTTYTGLHYVGVMISATTMPSICGCSVYLGVNKAPGMGASDTAQTTPPAFPHTAAAPTEASPNQYYVYLT